MPTYSICNIALESDLRLPELEWAEGRTPEIRFLMTRRALSDSADCEWVHNWTLPDGTPWLAIGRQARGYLLRFQEMADFAVSRDAREILCYAASDTPSETVRHLLLDQVLPLVLSSRGQLVVHGSAVLTPGGTIAFVGDSGSGKSTLASSFTEDGMDE
jgi:ABC-type multidrug transport system fused ATPase/permease subunit